MDSDSGSTASRPSLGGKTYACLKAYLSERCAKARVGSSASLRMPTNEVHAFVAKAKALGSKIDDICRAALLDPYTVDIALAVRETDYDVEDTKAAVCALLSPATWAACPLACAAAFNRLRVPNWFGFLPHPHHSAPFRHNSAAGIKALVIYAALGYLTPAQAARTFARGVDAVDVFSCAWTHIINRGDMAAAQGLVAIVERREMCLPREILREALSARLPDMVLFLLKNRFMFGTTEPAPFLFTSKPRTGNYGQCALELARMFEDSSLLDDILAVYCNAAPRVVASKSPTFVVGDRVLADSPQYRAVVVWGADGADAEIMDVWCIRAETAGVNHIRGFDDIVPSGVNVWAEPRDDELPEASSKTSTTTPLNANKPSAINVESLDLSLIHI